MVSWWSTSPGTWATSPSSTEPSSPRSRLIRIPILVDCLKADSTLFYLFFIVTCYFYTVDQIYLFYKYRYTNGSTFKGKVWVVHILDQLSKGGVVPSGVYKMYIFSLFLITLTLALGTSNFIYPSGGPKDTFWTNLRKEVWHLGGVALVFYVCSLRQGKYGHERFISTTT